MKKETTHTPSGKKDPAERFGRPFRAFADPGYVRLWLSICLSETARWMQMALVAWLVLELTDSSWKVSLVGFFFWFPTLVLGLAGGLLADAMDRRRLLIITLWGSIAASLVMTAILAAGAVRAWQAYLTVLINGTAWVIGFPSRRALIFDLLGARGVTNGIALDILSMNISRGIGPVLGGGLITISGVAGGYGVVTVFYAAALVLLVSLQAGPAVRRVNRDKRVFQNLMEGFRYIRRTPVLLAIVWITVTVNLLLFPYIPLVSVMSRDVMHVGPTLMGVLQAAHGFGAVVGSILIASAVRIVFHGRIFVAGTLVSFLGLGIFSISGWYGVSFAGLLCLGLGSAGFSVMQSAVVMLVAGEDIRGRAMGVVSFAIGAGPLGALVLGATASAVGPVPALGINAVLGFTIVAVIAAVMPSTGARTSPGAPSP